MVPFCTFAQHFGKKKQHQLSLGFCTSTFHRRINQPCICFITHEALCLMVLCIHHFPLCFTLLHSLTLTIVCYQLTFKEHIAKTAQSCRFALYNIRKIRPFLTEHATQLLVQSLVISRLDYCNALLAGLPSNTIKPLQMIQNAAARLVFNEPKRAHVIPLFVSLHWLPVAARIQFKTLMLAFRQPQAQHPPTSTQYYKSTSPPEV